MLSLIHILLKPKADKPASVDTSYVKTAPEQRDLVNALSGTGASLAGILRGETFTPRELLYAALLPSGNEAAMMLGDYVGDGSLDYFAEMMNEKAAELGAVNTHFVNASGMHDDDHYTTAYDMYLITMAALENETFREIVSTNYYLSLIHI